MIWIEYSSHSPDLFKNNRLNKINKYIIQIFYKLSNSHVMLQKETWNIIAVFASLYEGGDRSGQILSVKEFKQTGVNLHINNFIQILLTVETVTVDNFHHLKNIFIYFPALKLWAHVTHSKFWVCQWTKKKNYKSPLCNLNKSQNNKRNRFCWENLHLISLYKHTHKHTRM